MQRLITIINRFSIFKSYKPSPKMLLNLQCWCSIEQNYLQFMTKTPSAGIPGISLVLRLGMLIFIEIMVDFRLSPANVGVERGLIGDGIKC